MKQLNIVREYAATYVPTKDSFVPPCLSSIFPKLEHSLAHRPSPKQSRFACNDVRAQASGMAAEKVPPCTPPSKAEGATPLTFDDETACLLEQLHRAWATRAPASTYVAIRDAILRQCDHVDTRILTLTTVVRLAYREVDSDPQWHELLALADRANIRSRRDGDDCDDSHAKTSKGNSRSRVYNEQNRLRNLAIVAALWSPSLVDYYGWNTSTQVQMNMLRACATRYPSFDHDFRPRLNRVLIARNCLSLKNSRCKTLNEAPLQPHRDLDLVALATAVPDEALETQWVSNQDGRIPVDDAGTLLRDLRPAHFPMYLLRRDRYNLLVSRSAVNALSPQISSADASLLNSVAPSIQDVQYRSLYNIAGSSSESSLLSTTAISTPPQAKGSDMQSDTPLTEFLNDQTCAYGQFDLGETFDFDANAIVTDPGIQTTSWGRPDLHARTHVGTLLDEHSLNQTCDYEQFDLDASLDFGVSTPVLLPEFEASSGAHMGWEGFVEHDMSPPSTAVVQPQRENFSHFSQGLLSNRQLNISSPPCLAETTPTYEEALHTKYCSLITTYTRLVFAEAKQPGASDQYLSRAQWLSPETPWASVWTHPDSQLLAGRAQSCDEADIIVVGSDDFIAALRQGHVFNRPVIVKEAFSDSGLHSLDVFSRLLREILPDTHVHPLETDIDRLKGMPVDTIVESMRRNDWSEKQGLIFNLRAIARSHQPLLTLLPRFRLLDNLIEKLRGADLCEPTTVGSPSWARSNTLSLQGAFTGAQLNATGGVWMRNLSGVHFWTLIPNSNMNASEWPDDGSIGNNWAPRGKQRFFVLEQDDVLFIPPGLCVAHALHSPTNVLSDRGVLWDSKNLVQTLNSMYWMLKRQADRNGVWDLLPQLLVELERLVKHQLDQFTGECSKSEFIEAVREVTSRLLDLGVTYANRPRGQ